MNTLYDIINILPLPLISLILFGSYAGIPQEKKIPCVICLAVSVWILILCNMTRKNRLRTIGAVSAFVAGVAAAAGKENRQIFIEEYFWVVSCVLFTAAVVAAGILIMKNIWLKRITAAAMFVCCIAGTLYGRTPDRIAFLLICFFLLVHIAEEIQRRWKKSGYTDIREHITRISPFFAALCLAVYLLPVPSEPYDWKFAKNIYYMVVSGVNRIYGDITHPFDDYGNIGFSEKSSFLSELGDKDEDVLYITSDNRTAGNIRLAGCISSEFRNGEWVFDADAEDNHRMTDTLETVCAVTKYDPSYKTDYMRKTELYCENLFYNTHYIFAPSKIRLENTIKKNLETRKKDIEIKVKDLGITEKNGSIVTEQKLRFSDEYIISCYVLNYGNPYLEDFLAEAQPIDEAEWNVTLKSEGAYEKKGYTYEDYQRYRRDVYEIYCRSYGVSDRTRELLDRIEDGSESRYETAKRLETYLNSMEYSTDCGPLPASVTDGESFLDYFLFSSGKGYCVHFATAYVLMAEEMGIPCRYVQGYNVSRGADGHITVRQSNAHAWPEVYFDNVGWIAFEPTPGYAVPAGWKTAERKEAVPDVKKREPTVVPVYEETVTPEPEQKKIDPLIFIIPAAAVTGFLVLFYIISRSLSGSIYRKMGMCEKFRYLTGQNLRLLGFLGFNMQEGETLEEFHKRISLSDREDIKSHLGFIPVYENVLYSDREISKEDVSSAETACDALSGLVRKSSLRYRLMLMIKK